MLQEYNISWEYIPGKKNIAADTLSRINVEDQTFEGEKETVIKLYNIIKSRSNIDNIVQKIGQHQKQDS